MYWLVQLVSLTMDAVSNVRWQGSKIRQCRLESRDTICESMGECTQAHKSSQYLTNQKRPTSHVQYDIKIDRKMFDCKLLSNDKMPFMAQ